MLSLFQRVMGTFRIGDPATLSPHPRHRRGVNICARREANIEAGDRRFTSKPGPSRPLPEEPATLVKWPGTNPPRCSSCFLPQCSKGRLRKLLVRLISSGQMRITTKHQPVPGSELALSARLILSIELALRSLAHNGGSRIPQVLIRTEPIPPLRERCTMWARTFIWFGGTTKH